MNLLQFWDKKIAILDNPEKNMAAVAVFVRRFKKWGCLIFVENASKMKSKVDEMRVLDQNGGPPKIPGGSIF